MPVYVADFLRPQGNWTLALPAKVQDAMDEPTQAMFALSPRGNTRIGGAFTKLKEAA